jgi:3-oxoacyl-[acyl-carrier protein] reductase
MELKGRVAIVTGAGRNIGRAIALDLASAGAAIVVNARTGAAEAEAVAAEIRAGGGRALAALADVADEAAVARMVAESVAAFGRLDILVNNAAVRPRSELEALGLAEWRRVLATVLDGAFLCAKACLPYLRRSDRAAIVNIGGVSGHTGARARLHVVTAKAGLVGLTRGLAQEVARDGITVNCVVPGLIETARSAPSHLGAGALPPLGRLGKPEEIAAAVRYLCGPGVRFVTGQVLHASGGHFMG